MANRERRMAWPRQSRAPIHRQTFLKTAGAATGALLCGGLPQTISSRVPSSSAAGVKAAPWRRLWLLHARRPSEEWLLQPEEHAQIAENPLEPGVPALKSVQTLKQFQENRFIQAAIAQKEYWGLLPYWHPYWAALAEKDWHPNFQLLLQRKTTTKPGFSTAFCG